MPARNDANPTRGVTMKKILLFSACFLLLAIVAHAADSTMTSTTSMSTSEGGKKGATEFYVGAGYSAFANGASDFGGTKPKGSLGAHAGVDYMLSPQFSVG